MKREQRKTCEQIWKNVAIAISTASQATPEFRVAEQMSKIPVFESNSLDAESYNRIKQYLFEVRASFDLIALVLCR